MKIVNKTRHQKALSQSGDLSEGARFFMLLYNKRILAAQTRGNHRYV
jgi:hypothetical protein